MSELTLIANIKVNSGKVDLVKAELEKAAFNMIFIRTTKILSISCSTR